MDCYKTQFVLVTVDHLTHLMGAFHLYDALAYLLCGILYQSFLIVNTSFIHSTDFSVNYFPSTSYHNQYRDRGEGN